MPKMALFGIENHMRMHGSMRMMLFYQHSVKRIAIIFQITKAKKRIIVGHDISD